VAAVMVTWALVTLTVIDLDHQILPDSITLPLLWLGLLASLAWSPGVAPPIPTDPRSAIVGAVGGYLSLWSVYWAFKLTTGKEGMGYGDFKLFGALGAWMGWQMLPLILLLSAFTGAVVGIVLIVVRGLVALADLALIGEMSRPDVAFLPIGGHYTMGPAGAARAAKLLGVRAVVPIHYGTFPILAGTPDQLRDELLGVGASVDVIAPERGVATPLP